MPEVDSRKAPRRAVAYDSLDHIVADAERLVDAGVTTTGNWTLPQIIDHIATAMDFQVDGFPPNLSLNPLLRAVVRLLFKKRVLTSGMSPGFRLRAPAAKALVKEQNEVDASAALAHLRRSVARLQAATTCADHGAFGPMTKEEAVLLHRRHAELHMSFSAEP